MSTSSKIYDHIAGKFVDAQSEEGKQIAKINKICDKCNIDKIYNPLTKRCVSQKGSNADKYSDEINYCKKYYSYKMKSINSDINVFNNILNIKIPKKFVKNNKSFLIKDIFDKKLVDSQEKSLAAKLNIKNIKYKKYINYLPALVYSIYQVLSMNSEARGYLISAITSILNTFKGGIMALYIKICVDYLNTPYLISILSNFSFNKFFVFITGILVVLTNLPSKLLGNKYVTRRISDVTLNGKTNPILANITPLNTDTYKKVELNEAQQTILSKFNAYNNYDKTVNLSKLGINTVEVADPNTNITFGYDDISQTPFVELINRTGKTSYWIFPKERRIKNINEIKNKTESLINELDSKKQGVIDTRESHSNHLKSLRLRDNIQQATEDLETLRKFTPIYNKTSKKLESMKKELDETNNYLRKKKYTVLDPVELKVLQPKLTEISNWKYTVSDLYKYSKKLDNSNINAFYPTMMQTIESATNFVKSVDQLNIVPKAVNHSTIPSRNIPTSVIKNNLNTINSQIVAQNNISAISSNVKNNNIMNSILAEMGTSSVPDKKKVSPPKKTKMIDFTQESSETYDSMSKLKDLLNSDTFDPNIIAAEEIAINLKAFDTTPGVQLFKMRRKAKSNKSN